MLFLICQTLCILANIADGNTAKELIMTNDDMLQKIKYYMVLCVKPSTVAHPCDQIKCLALLQHAHKSSHGKQIMQYAVPTENYTVVFFFCSFF